MYKRIQTFPKRHRETCFLWGARQTGKSTLLKQLFPQTLRYDLLLSDQFDRFNRHPSLLREEILALPKKPTTIIIDEVQKIPLLLDDIHWLITNTPFSFILSGSSARKLKKGGGNLLGGRALRYELYPLVSQEIPDFDLLRALNHGLIPRHYLADEPERMIQAYIGDYLKEEIAAEAVSRNIPVFGRFLEAAAFSNGNIVNYHNIAAECGVSGPTIKGYFEILEDTLIGYTLPSFQKRPKRRVIQAPKFYFFDVGLVNVLLKRKSIQPRSEVFGWAFEHLIFQELKAHQHYSALDYALRTWRTASQLEVDFVLGDHEVIVEVKGTHQVKQSDLKGLLAFKEEYKVKKAVVVSMDTHARQVDGIAILPWKVFFDQLWQGDIIN